MHFFPLVLPKLRRPAHGLRQLTLPAFHSDGPCAACNSIKVPYKPLGLLNKRASQLFRTQTWSGNESTFRVAVEKDTLVDSVVLKTALRHRAAGPWWPWRESGGATTTRRPRPQDRPPSFKNSPFQKRCPGADVTDSQTHICTRAKVDKMRN